MHNASEVSRFEISQGKMMLDKGKQRKLRVGIFIFCIPILTTYLDPFEEIKTSSNFSN